ncbi:unnamed protein product [Ambrosiozyma monospora]|uniref:Unnamed protein product n=1 Tax=Ambrosiozyma monospora TaxID=43982 RepID=A0ACB5TT19_AMBMO|nr:unnamed protein product [Ambrosiozyma monospora]
MGGTVTLDNQNVASGANVGIVNGTSQVQGPNGLNVAPGFGMGSVAGTGSGPPIASSPITPFNPQVGIQEKYEDSAVSSEYNIDDQIYHEVIDIVQKDMGIVVQSVTLLSSESINRYLSQYWTHFDPSFPVIHKPTFKSTRANSMQKFLTLAMITIGMAFMNPDASVDVGARAGNRNGAKRYTDEYMLALEIHDSYKTRLLSEMEKFRNYNKVPLELIQAVFLTDYFLFYLGSRYQLKSAHNFHAYVCNILSDLEMFQTLSEPALIRYEDNNNSYNNSSTNSPNNNSKSNTFPSLIVAGTHGSNMSLAKD